MLKLLHCRAGATAIEYGLIVALIAIAIITVLGTLGVNLQGVFSNPALTGAAP
jgi:pilus assembly protein Flp/PilA